MPAIASLVSTSLTVFKAPVIALEIATVVCQAAVISGIINYLRRLPRPCRFRWKSTTVLLTNELAIHQSFSGKARNRFQESPLVIIFSLVKPERLLIQISEQMKRLDVHIGPFDSALQQRPKVFKAISVNMTLGAGLRMVDHLMNVFVRKLVIRGMAIGNNFRTLLNIGSHFGVKIAHANPTHEFTPNARRLSTSSLALQEPKYRCLAKRASPFFEALVLVHIARLCADVGFIRLNATGKLLNRAVVHRQTDTVKHEPCSFLRDAKRASKFARTDSVLSVDDQPRCRQPFFQSKRTVLKDRSDFDAELFLARFAIPNPARLHKVANVLRITARAMNAARPSHLAKKLVASVRVAEISNRPGQGFGNIFCVHASNLPAVS